MDLSFVILGGPFLLRTDRHRLAGVVTVDGAPAKRLVVAIDRRTLTLIAATLSDSITGAWEIKGIQEYPERSLVVISFDNTGNYNAEIADYVSQVATV